MSPQAQAIDFSDLGGRPVTAKGIDFSDLGGKKVEVISDNSGLSGPAKPNVQMHNSYLFGDPNEVPVHGVMNTLKEPVEGTINSLARVSTPGVAATYLNKFAPNIAAKLSKVPYVGAALHGAASPDELLRETMLTGLIGMEGGLLEPNKVPVAAGVRLAIPRSPEGLAPEHVAAIDKANAPFVRQVAANELAQQQSTIASRIQQGTQALHEQVRGTLNQRWDALRGRMEGATVPTQPITGAIEQSQKMLAGVPDDLKIFKEITHAIDQGSAEAAAERVTPEGLAPVQPGGLSFNDARIQASALGEKWAGASGNLRRALRNVYDAYNKSLQGTADAAGNGREYQALREDWHQYVEDWQGRGPLNKVLNAPHPDYIVNPATKIPSTLLQQQLQRYPGGGAVAEDIAGLKDLTKAAKVPPLKVVTPPPPPAPQPGFIARHVPRVIGKMIGGSIGAKLGHPLIGYSVGGEVGAEVGRKLTIPRTPEEYTRTILAAKEGTISPDEANRRIARGGGSVRVLRQPSKREE